MHAQERAHEDVFTDNEQDPVEDFQVVSQITAQSSVTAPLPLDLPPVPNLSSLPAHILHSGTVETLIGQNEDLMARLKVNIRRNSILEQQIMEQDRLHARLKNEHATLVAQYQVLDEKSSMLREKAQRFDQITEELRDENMVMQARVDGAEERSAELRAGLRFEEAYRRRVRNWVRPYIDALKSRLTDSRARIQFLDRQLATREAVIGDLRARLETSTKLVQDTTVTANRDQAMLVATYEERLQANEADALKARQESALLRDKASRLDDAISRATRAENTIVTLERKNQDLEATLGGELKTIQDQLGDFRREAKALAAEVMTANDERERATAAEKEAVAELARARDQFESLQAVWAEAQKKFEASRLQQDALNKLNQELSRQLKAQRLGQTPAPVAEPPAGLSVEAVQPNRLEKIDSLLAELESGFTKANLDFIEDTPAREASL